MSTHRHRTRPARVKHEHVMHRSMPRRAQAGLRWPAHRSRASSASPRSLTILAALVLGSAAGLRLRGWACASTVDAIDSAPSTGTGTHLSAVPVDEVHRVPCDAGPPREPSRDVSPISRKSLHFRSNSLIWRCNLSLRYSCNLCSVPGEP